MSDGLRAGFAAGLVAGFVVGVLVGRVGLVTDVLGWLAAGFPDLLSMDLLTVGRVVELDSELFIEDVLGLDVLEDLVTLVLEALPDVDLDVDTVLDVVEPVPLLVCAKASD